MKGKQAERQEIWRQLIEEKGKSGQSVRAFCRGRNVAEHSFYMWRRRFEREAPVSFALVEAKAPSQPETVDLFLSGGERLRIPAETNILRVVLAALRKPS